LQLLAVSHRFTTIVALYQANAPSSVDGALSAVASTWRAALAAARHNQILSNFYQHLRAKENLTNSL